MTINVLNVGSINVDYIYRVPRFVRPGETLASSELNQVLGGKGANQSVALAKAGAGVAHFGQVGVADSWAIDELGAHGVNMQHTRAIKGSSGHAIIQVDDAGENAIVLHGGANQTLDQKQLELAQAATDSAEYLLLQNECNLLAEAIHLGARRGLKICLNPAPMTREILELPLEKVNLLIVNEVEAQALTDCTDDTDLIAALTKRLPVTDIVLTLGARGAVFIQGDTVIKQPAFPAQVIDTTAAGDTFVGYFLAGCVNELPVQQNLARACQAAALAVEQVGAIPSIPNLERVLSRC